MKLLLFLCGALAACGLSRIPVGRVGSIHDIAHAVRFLCHPDSGLSSPARC